MGVGIQNKILLFKSNLLGPVLRNFMATYFLILPIWMLKYSSTHQTPNFFNQNSALTLIQFLPSCL